MFGEEVSDIALNYLLTLTRETHIINSEVRKGNWYKPAGRTLTGRKVALIVFGKSEKRISNSFSLFKSIFKIPISGIEDFTTCPPKTSPNN